MTEKELEQRLDEVRSDERYYHLHKIDNAIFNASVDYFRKVGAEWCNLPLTTLMISSPGEVYAGQRLDYTTDALPVELDWFKNNRKIFLAESAQFYLEMRLLIRGIDRVFCIYNSFRKEKTDFSHLSEFQHIEFEGKVDFNENTEIFINLLKHVTRTLVKDNAKNLKYFLKPEDVAGLKKAFDPGRAVKRLTFDQAMAVLYEDTEDKRYRERTMKHFGAWEEIRLTNIFQKHVLITEFPLLEIPFYHDEADAGDNKKGVAKNADLILCGYRETVGGGTRISDPEKLKAKAALFNLPPEDYAPYLRTRKAENYEVTSGFGLGWQRYVHWLLKLPFIWDACHVPRTHYLPKP